MHTLKSTVEGLNSTCLKTKNTRKHTQQIVPMKLGQKDAKEGQQDTTLNAVQSHKREDG